MNILLVDRCIFWLYNHNHRRNVIDIMSVFGDCPSWNKLICDDDDDFGIGTNSYEYASLINLDMTLEKRTTSLWRI